MDDLECKQCNLKIYDGEVHQLQPMVNYRRNIRCVLGSHRYIFLVCLYENAEPLSAAIFKVCGRCGKGRDAPVAFEFINSVVKMAQQNRPQEGGIK